MNYKKRIVEDGKEYEKKLVKDIFIMLEYVRKSGITISDELGKKVTQLINNINIDENNMSNDITDDLESAYTAAQNAKKAGEGATSSNYMNGVRKI